MKKILLLALVCALTVTAAFARTEPAVQSMGFTGPSVWLPGTTIALNANLSYSGYNSYGLSYWLEVPTAIASALQITNAQYFTFTDPNNIFGFPIAFSDTAGSRPGYMGTNRDLGATTNPVPPGIPGLTNSTITTLTFSIGANALPGTYTMFTTSLSPRISAVTDTLFGDNNIIPPGQFVFTVVPEPSTLALVALGTVASGLVFYRRRKTTR